MSLTIPSKYKYFDSTVQRAEDRREKFHFCRLPFAVNVMLNLSINQLYPSISLHKIAADMALEATSIFLNDVRSAVGDDTFAKFLNLKSENSMALVIDVSGSMSGES